MPVTHSTPLVVPTPCMEILPIPYSSTTIAIALAVLILVMNVQYCQTPDQVETWVSGANSAEAILLIHIHDTSLVSTTQVTLSFNCNISIAKFFWDFLKITNVKVRGHIF